MTMRDAATGMRETGAGIHAPVPENAALPVDPEDTVTQSPTEPA